MHDYRDVSDGRRRSARDSTPLMIHADQTSQGRSFDHESGAVPSPQATVASTAPPTFLPNKRKASNVPHSDARQAKRARVSRSTETASGPQPASNHPPLTRSSSKKQEMQETQSTASESHLKPRRSTRLAQVGLEASGSRPTRAQPRTSTAADLESRSRKRTQADSGAQG